jgi:hypothetical protein
MASGFAGVPARKMKPTVKHRIAMWENMLGTVYAMNEKGEVEYFDYKWDDAQVFAGIRTAKDAPFRNDRDLRVFKASRNMNGYLEYEKPSKGKLVLWILREGA